MTANPYSIVPIIHRNAERLGNAPAFRFLSNGEVDGPIDSRSFADLLACVRAVASALRREGLSGERALLIYPPGLDFVTAFLGCLSAGVIAVPAYPPDIARLDRTLPRLRAIARDCQASVMLTSSEIAAAAQSMLPLLPELATSRVLVTDEISTSEANGFVPIDFLASDVAFLQYTSGSTTEPKGVKVTHGSILANSQAIARLGNHSEESIAVSWLPCYHDMGLIGGILGPLFVGFVGNLMSPIAFLKKPERWLRAISRLRGTTSAFPNFALDLCVRKVPEECLAQLDLSSWEIAWNGAETVRSGSLERFYQRFSRCGFRREAFLPVYGLAEATLIVTGERDLAQTTAHTLDRSALGKKKVRAADAGTTDAATLVGCGRAISGHEVVIANPETCRRAASDEVGEIWVRGPSVAAGYWRRSEESEAAFAAVLADTGEGPFLRTGDLGFLVDRQLFVAGRRKDLIVIRGANYYPQDIEEAVERAHETIRAGSVAAVSLDSDREEGLGLLIEVRDDLAQQALKELVLRIRETVATTFGLVPRRIVLLPMGALLKTSSGKIQRAANRDALVQGNFPTLLFDARDEFKAAPQASLEPGALDPIQERALAVLCRVTGFPRAALRLDTRLVGVIGLDSLRIAELVTELEKEFGSLGSGIFSDSGMTLADLLRVLSARVSATAVLPIPEQVEAAPIQHPEISRQERIEDFEEVAEIRTLLLLFQALKVENPYWSSLAGVARDVVEAEGASLINFATYNYLGLSGDERVNAAAIDALKRYGTSASASRVASGDRPVHRALESAIASFLGCEQSLVFASGHATNVTALSTLCERPDLILHDSLAHNSIVLGAQLSGARRVVFPHNDLDTLERLLRELRGSARRALIAVEGVYSMDGDLAPLTDLITLKKRYGALLYVDEAHSLGCIGATGRGIGEQAGVARSDVDVWMGTLSKALASCGGYIAGSRALIDFMKYRGGGFVYAAAISPQNAAAALEALRILAAEPFRVSVLKERAALFLDLCRARGVDTGASSGSAIVPVIVGTSVRCVQVADSLRRRGIHVPPIFYPAVEEGRARLRFFLSALHSEAQLRQAADSLAEALREHPDRHPAARSLGSLGSLGSSRTEAPVPARSQPQGTTREHELRRVFVTGASGFIGSRVARELIARGCEVRCLLRPSSKTHRLAGLRYEVQQGDLADRAALDAGAAGCDAVIHLACASAWSELRSLGPRIDSIAVDGTRNVLLAAQKAGVRRFVHVSSAVAVNGSEDPSVFDEASPYELEGRGLAYSMAKRRAEALVLSYAERGIDAVIACPAEVYGPGDDGLVTAGALLDILRSHTPIACDGGTSIAHVDDVAQGIVAALFRGRPGERYILGGQNLTVHELTRMVLRLSGRKDSVIAVPNDALFELVRLMREAGMPSPISEDVLEYATLYWFMDSDKARRELGYAPRDAEKTLSSVVNWLADSQMFT